MIHDWLDDLQRRPCRDVSLLAPLRFLFLTLATSSSSPDQTSGRGVWHLWLLTPPAKQPAQFGIFLPSKLTIRRDLSNEQFWRTTSPFTWGYSGVVLRCSMPCACRNDSNSSDTNWRPLSVFRENGAPNLAKIGVVTFYFHPEKCLKS